MPSRTQNDRTVTRGEYSTTVYSRQVSKRALHGRGDDPDRETLRAYLKDNHCWWCERGPWKSIASHTYHAHGITAAELREMAHFFKDGQLVSDAYHDQLSRASIENNSAQWLIDADHSGKGKRSTSEAGKESMRARLTDWWEHIGPEAARQQRLEANRKAVAKLRKPTPCVQCGKPMPRAYPKTCSPECRREIRKQTAIQSSQKIDYSRLRRPHPCRMCGTIIPTSQRRMCSPECVLAEKRSHRRLWPCTVCGKDTGTKQRRTCSPEHLLEARRRNGLAHPPHHDHR